MERLTRKKKTGVKFIRGVGRRRRRRRGRSWIRHGGGGGAGFLRESPRISKKLYRKAAKLKLEVENRESNKYRQSK